MSQGKAWNVRRYTRIKSNANRMANSEPTVALCDDWPSYSMEVMTDTTPNPPKHSPPPLSLTSMTIPYLWNPPFPPLFCCFSSIPSLLLLLVFLSPFHSTREYLYHSLLSFKLCLSSFTLFLFSTFYLTFPLIAY